MPTLLNKYVLDRRKVYDKMGADVHTKGLLLGGVITQGLRQRDLFLFNEEKGQDSNRHIKIQPVLRGLDIPVRAMVLPLLNRTASSIIKSNIDQVLMPNLPEASIWLQDDQLYHATIYHASSHVVSLGFMLLRWLGEWMRQDSMVYETCTWPLTGTPELPCCMPCPCKHIPCCSECLHDCGLDKS